MRKNPLDRHGRSCECGSLPTTSAISSEVAAVVDERSVRKLLARAEFDQIQRSFIRTLGERASVPGLGSSVHVRVTTATEAGQFAAEHDVALAELEAGPESDAVIRETVTSCDLHAVDLGDGLIPVMNVVVAPLQQAVDVHHAVHHAVELGAPSSETDEFTDGGTCRG